MSGITQALIDACAPFKVSEICDGCIELVRGDIEQCARVTDFEIPEGVTRIDEDAFKGFTSLREVHAPEQIKKKIFRRISK